MHAQPRPPVPLPPPPITATLSFLPRPHAHMAPPPPPQPPCRRKDDLCLDTFLDCRAVQMARGARQRALYRQMHARLAKGAGVDFRLFQRVVPGLVAEEVKRRGRAIRAAAARNRVLERGLRLALAKMRRLLLAGKVGR